MVGHQRLDHSQMLYDTDKSDFKLQEFSFSVIKPNTVRSSHQRCSVKMVFLNILRNSQKNTSARVSFIVKEAWIFIKNEILAQVFSCEFLKIFRNTFFTENLGATASALCVRFTIFIISL